MKDLAEQIEKTVNKYTYIDGHRYFQTIPHLSERLKEELLALIEAEKRKAVEESENLKIENKFLWAERKEALERINKLSEQVEQILQHLIKNKAVDNDKKE